MVGSNNVLLAVDSSESEERWRFALRSQGLAVETLPSQTPLREFLAARDRNSPARMLVLDLRVLKRAGVSLAAFGAWFEQNCPSLKLAVTADAKFEVSAAEQTWAAKHRASCLLPALSPYLVDVTASSVMARLLATLGIDQVDERDLRRMLLALSNVAPESERADALAYAHAGRLQAEGHDIAQLAHALHAEVERAPRSYLGKNYANCFLGSDACTWLAQRFNCNRTEAVDIGNALRARGFLHHVVKEHAFADSGYFYRCVEDEAAIDAIDLDQIVNAMPSVPGLIATRSYLGKSYPACCVGQELVDWLCRGSALTREQAVNLGQRLIDLCLMQHVVHERAFVDDYLFYRFCAA